MKHILLILFTTLRYQFSSAFQIASIVSKRPSSILLSTKEKSNEEWKQILTPEQYYVLREEGTERPWTSPLNDVKDEGLFKCAGCGSPLFSSSTKYESGSGWPSFFDPIDADSVDLSVDYKLVVPRTEVTCKNCNGHLGHVFDDGPQPTGKRYCMNGVAMQFVTSLEDPELAKEVVDRMEKSKASGGMSVKEPLGAALPGIALDAAVSALFISSFFNKNGSGGLDLFSKGFQISQVLELIPLGIGIFYGIAAAKKIANLL